MTPGCIGVVDGDESDGGLPGGGSERPRRQPGPIAPTIDKEVARVAGGGALECVANGDEPVSQLCIDRGPERLVPHRPWQWGRLFLGVVGTDPDTLPPEVPEEAAPMVPLVRRSRPPWEREPPAAGLAAAPFPKLVVSGGHSTGFDAVCDELADRIGADRAEVSGAGHEIQFTGPAINAALVDFWHALEQTDDTRTARDDRP